MFIDGYCSREDTKHLTDVHYYRIVISPTAVSKRWNNIIKTFIPQIVGYNTRMVTVCAKQQALGTFSWNFQISCLKSWELDKPFLRSCVCGGSCSMLVTPEHSRFCIFSVLSSLGAGNTSQAMSGVTVMCCLVSNRGLINQLSSYSYRPAKCYFNISKIIK